MKKLKSMFNKIFCLFLVISLLFISSLPASASEVSNNLISTDICKKIIYALNNSDITRLGINNIKLEEIIIGNEIEAYEYCDSLLKLMPIKLYPLSHNGKLIAFAIKYNFVDLVQISTALVSEISSIIDQSVPFALIYDNEKCYMYTTNGLLPLYNINHEISNRQSIQGDVNTSIFNSINLNMIGGNQCLGYEPSVSLNETAMPATSLPSYISLNVSFVTQNPPSLYCWASAAACVGNYLTGYNLSGMNVAAYLYGIYNYNQGADGWTSISTMNSIYGTSYNYQQPAPPTSVITDSLFSGKPLFTSWSGTYGHACVIYGINVIGGYIYIMDPEYGFASAVPYANTYIYTSLYSGGILSVTGYGA